MKKILMYLFWPNANVVEISFDNYGNTDARIIVEHLNMANGINFSKGKLVVNEPTLGIVNVYEWDQIKNPVLKKSIKLEMIADNINFDKEGNLLVGGWMGPLLNSIKKNHNMKSMIVEIDKDTLAPTKTIFYDIEGKYSVSSAAKFEDSFWIGSPTRPLLICKK